MNMLVIPTEVSAARTLIEGFDRVLLSGFSRLGAEELEALRKLERVVSHSPLGPAVSTAIAALARGELLAHHLIALAAARASLEGAIADALLTPMLNVAGLTLEPVVCAASPAPDAPTGVLMESAQQWLVEIALAGLGQLEHGTVQPVIGALRPLQEAPQLRHLAALLTGFSQELMDHTPTANVPVLPARRWADLWSMALLATHALPDVASPRSVSGVLTPLGIDLRHHDTIISAVVHAHLLEKDGVARLVRITLSAWKVDAITGPEVLARLTPLAPQLFEALGSPKALELEGATLLGGDLLWDGEVKKSSPCSLQGLVKGALFTPPRPRDRHVLQLAVPVVCATDALPAPLDFSRASALAELDASMLEGKGVEGVVGLLRFDETYTFQPLAVVLKKGLRGPADALEKSAKVKAKDSALAVLEERASRLLRRS